ncbi:energy transducer TonB [Variovorax guangxiensis]|uniref:energy transducer TonB n=1 Tax=Variovorax guangxiensis TaxID=1775474 RepID=UPI00286BE072|nr:energy transducer TonB [Variovorax guangxiensis]
MLNDAPPRETRASYGDIVASAVRANVVFTKEIVGNPLAEITVNLAPDGGILKTMLARSSGVKEWDDAALRAVQRTAYIPLDEKGRVPTQMIIALRPKR